MKKNSAGLQGEFGGKNNAVPIRSSIPLALPYKGTYGVRTETVFGVAVLVGQEKLFTERAMFKKLTRQGNSTALILDRQIMELLEIDRDAVVKVSVHGRQLIVEPLSDEERAMKIKEIQKKTLKKNAELFKRLAK